MKILKKCVRLSRDMIHLTESRCKHFSFLIKKNKIISIGYNQPFKTHPLAKELGYRFSCIHSELHCLVSAKRIEGMMINIRLDKFGNIRGAKPCPKCEKLLSRHGIPCIYSTDNGDFYV